MNLLLSYGGPDWSVKLYEDERKTGRERFVAKGALHSDDEALRGSFRVVDAYGACGFSALGALDDALHAFGMAIDWQHQGHPLYRQAHRLRETVGKLRLEYFPQGEGVGIRV
tara:strand:- start:2895 stop:3230 length:336 start_codon:yes stop_codon:yes gene_type:complete